MGKLLRRNCVLYTDNMNPSNNSENSSANESLTKPLCNGHLLDPVFILHVNHTRILENIYYFLFPGNLREV